MWRHHLANLLSRSWANLLAALSSSTLSVVVFSVAMPTLIFVAVLIYNGSQARKADRSVIELLKSTVSATLIIGAGITLFCWLCLFSWSVATTIYRDHQDLVSFIPRAKQEQVTLDQATIDGLQRKIDDLAKRKPEVKEQCWMENITLPPPRTLPAPTSSSQAVMFCNTERKAPLVIFLDYDGPVLSAEPIIFPQGRQVSALEYVEQKRVSLKLDSPSILPYQIFAVRVYGAYAKPPLATGVSIKTIDSER